MHFRSLMLVVLCCLAGSGEILDRIAVSVGKRVITESDVVLDLRVAAFLDQKPVDLSGPAKRKAADRLVDQLLMQQDAALSRAVVLSNEEKIKLLDAVKAQYGSQAAYSAALARYHITEQELQDHLDTGWRNLRATELRFRPEIQLSDLDVRDFYETMAAGWRRENRPRIPSFEESRSQTEDLLTEQRVTQALDRWLGTARNETQILYHEDVFR
jgi:hypothetical protein